MFALHFRQNIVLFLWMKKSHAILMSLGVIAICIVTLLVLLLPKKETLVLSPNKTLTISVNDMNIAVGQQVCDFYEISDNTAEISFELSKEGIIKIDNEKIEGLNLGEVTVEIKATNTKSSVSAKFNVKVYEKEYSFNFIEIKGCRFENEYIYISSSTFQFNIDIRDKDNQKVENVVFDIFSNNPYTIIDKSFSSILIIANENCILTFTFPKLSVTFSKIVIFDI